MSGQRLEPKELECWPFDVSRLPVGTKITDNRGIERIIRQHFTDPAGAYTWATQAKRTAKGMRYDRDGRNLNGTRGTSILLPETAILPAKVDGQEIDLSWLPVGTRFMGDGSVREIERIDPAAIYLFEDATRRTYTRTGRLYDGKTGRRRAEDMVVTSIVLPKRKRMPMAGEFDVPVAAHSTAPATAKPIARMPEATTHHPIRETPITPEPQPQPEAEPTKTDFKNIDLNSWEW